LVRRRLDVMSAAARHVCLAVAAAATPSPELIVAVRGDESLVAEGLRQAEAAGILEITPGNVRFCHPILRSLCYSRATESERRWVHRRLADSVVSREEQVRHLALASSGPDESLAQRASQAAREALLRGAAVAGAELADLAVELTPYAPVEVRVDRLSEAGRLHLAAFDPAGARSMLKAAVDLSPSGARRASALHQLARVEVYTEGVPTARPLLEQALEEAEESTLLKALIHKDLGFAMGLSSDGFAPATIEHFRAALVMAEDLEEHELVSELEAFHAVAEFVAGHGVRRRLLERALSNVPRYRRLAMEQRPRVVISHVLRSNDDLEGARRLLEAEFQEASEQGAETDLPFVVMHLVTLHTWLGDLDGAEMQAKQGAEIARASGAVTQLACMHGAQAIFLAFRGPLEEARTHAEAAMDAGLRSGVNYPVFLGGQALGLIELVSGRPAAAHAVLGTISEVVAGWHLVDPGWIALRAVPDDIEALVRMGDLEGAEALLAPLEERADRVDRISALAAAGRCRALLMSAKGDDNEAARALDGAFAAHERLEMPLELARTHLVAGEVHRRGRRRQLARDHCQKARDVFSRLGATPWTHRARSDLARLGAERSDGPELTPVQRQVATLVAAGHTNREVAAELYMGLRTVEAHLSAVYRKLGIRSRSELAATWTERPTPQT
jgi:DNA-binding CsgD family transcriptional regulator